MLNSETLSAKISAIIGIADTMVSLIKSHGEDGMPSGHLYALVMGCMNLSQYEKFIGVLIEARRITKRGDLLFAV